MTHRPTPARMLSTLAALPLLLPMVLGAALAAPADLAVVRPVRDCAALAGSDLAEAVGATVRLEAAVADTPKGRFCRVTGTIAPAIGFEVALPLEGWTQRFLQTGCGGLCGSINASIGNAGGCRPALNGRFAVAASDLGHTGRMGSPDEGAFAADPQKRIDFAYRANHVTALAAKALIQAFYGQAPRFSYFSGCSDGGREALMEAERFPQDFDGISAGAPAMLFQVQNAFWHGWTAAANTRPDGSHILLAAKLPVLHAAVIRHCDGLDGTTDGLLSDPRACVVDPAWVRCSADASDTAGCLTGDEWAVAAAIYAGPHDGAGHRFLPGGAMPGSEMRWASFVPPVADGRQMSGAMLAAMAPVVLADATPADASAAGYPFTTPQFDRVTALHGLNDATNTNLHAFADRGGKLILWHGWSDDSIAPMISVAFYEGVRKVMGDAAADGFLRLFMIPGVGHCGGGDGFGQVDTLSPLMAWTEAGQAPAALVAGQVPERRGGPGGPPAGAPAQGADGRSGPQGPGSADRMRPFAPLAQPDVPASARRPIYPFPQIARYTGKNNPAAPENYVPATSPAAHQPVPDWYGSALLAPDTLRTYRVEGGLLTPLPR